MVTSLPSTASPSIYQIKVVLLDSAPLIWRRLRVPATIGLSRLHAVLQELMPWENSHLHAFHAGKDTYQIPDPGFDDMPMSGGRTYDERKFTLADVLQRPKQKLIYEYDFGDGWEHGLILEKILPPDPEFKRALCLDGENACPPDDCGGLGGYYHLLEVLADPKHAEHDELIEWIGGAFDPRSFDLASTNRFLNKVKL